jgi:hypothetical protein
VFCCSAESFSPEFVLSLECHFPHQAKRNCQKRHHHRQNLTAAMAIYSALYTYLKFPYYFEFKFFTSSSIADFSFVLSVFHFVYNSVILDLLLNFFANTVMNGMKDALILLDGILSSTVTVSI